MHRVLLVFLFSIIAVFPAAAQNGRQIFDIIVNGLDAELQRQQRLEQQRQFHDQQRRIDQHRLQQQQQRRAEWQAQRDMLEHHWNRCAGGDLSSCDQAVHSPVVSEQGRQQIRAQRQAVVDTAERERIQRALREQAEREQRARAEQAERERLADIERRRQQLEARERARRERRTEVQQTQAVNSQAAQIVHTGSIPAQFAAARSVAAAQTLAAAPPTGYLVAILVLASALMATLALLYRTRALSWNGEPHTTPAPDVETPAVDPTLATKTTSALTATDATPARAAASDPDPVTAAQALRLAQAYLEDVGPRIIRDMDEPTRLGDHRATLALAAKQLDVAARADAGTKLDLVDDDGETRHVPQTYLRATALTHEARTWILEKPSKAIELLVQATEIDPEHLAAYAIVGELYLDRRDKARAVAALSHAHAIAPDDMAIVMALDRARNLTGAERVAYTATQTAAGAASAAIAVGRAVQLMVALGGLALIVGLILSVLTGNWPMALAIWLIFAILGYCSMKIRALRLWWFWLGRRTTL